MERKFIISLFMFLVGYAHWGNSVEMEAIKICLTSNNYITDICQSLTFLALWNNYCSKHVIFSSDINREKIVSFFFYRILEFHYFSQSRNSNTISLLFLQAYFYHSMTSPVVSKMFTQQCKETFLLPHYQKSCQLLHYF